MELFVWHNICCVTDEYHKGGGLMIVAPDVDSARDTARKIRRSHQHEPPHPMPELKYWTGLRFILRTPHPEDCRELGEPSFRFSVPDEKVARVVVFPNKGCC